MNARYDPGALTGALILSGDEPPEARHLGLSVHLPVVLEAFAQLVREGVGKSASDGLAWLLIVVPRTPGWK